MNTINTAGGHAHHETLNVKVRYAAHSKPYEDPNASSAELLGTLKEWVLHHFGLKEGAVEGGNKVYVLTFEGVQQTDLSIALRSLAKGKHHLGMNLIEIFIQG